jgi:folate-binding Fe-S cluster repair protein YgfZ
LSRFALPYLAAARVVGPDAAAFLQAQLSADLSSLPAGGAGFACYCSPRGQVHALLLVLRSDEGFMVAGSAELLPALLQRLRRFVLRSRVDLVAADELTVWGLERTAANPEQDGPAAGTAAGLWYGIGTGARRRGMESARTAARRRLAGPRHHGTFHSADAGI